MNTFQRINRLSVLLAIVLVTLLVGCGNPPTATTPSPVATTTPNSPQTQAHNINKLFADSLNALVNSAIASRKAGNLSPDITRQIETWAGPATIVSDSIEAEIISTDTWPVQRQKIGLLLASFQVPTISSTIDPIVAAGIASVKLLLQQLQTQVAQ